MAVGVWMIVRGVELKPFVSLAAVVTIATGALVYHLRLKSRAPKDFRAARLIDCTRFEPACSSAEY